MEIGIAILALGVVVLGYLLLRAKEKLGGFKVTIEKDNVEKEIIEENRNATAIKEHELATASDDERVKLRRKWSRKP